MMLVRATLCLALLLAGCRRDNGLPEDLTRLLASNRIQVQVRGFTAPMSSRAGVIFLARDPAVEATIIARLNLKRIEPDSAEFRFIGTRITTEPEAAWGIAGRPAELKLAEGGQFEYLYLITTPDGRTLLAAEYAYG